MKKGGFCVKIVIEGEPKEIAALVFAAQERRTIIDVDKIIGGVVTGFSSALQATHDTFAEHQT